MKKFSYIGVAKDLCTGTKFLVRCDRPISARDIVAFKVGMQGCHAEIMRSAYFLIGGDEEAMLSVFGEIREVEKVYQLYWEKEEEGEKNGN